MQGKIVKGIAGFYYVHCEGMGIYECKAKGILRRDGRKPLPGDDVEFTVLSEDGETEGSAGRAGSITRKTGNITRLEQRRSALIRPAVANIEQALILFALNRPAPNLNLLDRFLIMMRRQELPVIICFNKQDLAGDGEREELERAYGDCGCRLLFVSALESEGLETLRELLLGRTTALAGPSGVGKSSLVNCLQHEVCMETGAISAKIGRGRHTTRHTELIAMGNRTYVMDTPGFSSLGLFDLEKEELRQYYPEFARYEDACRFQGCAHIHEPDCAVKEALNQGLISNIRYENYVQIYEELKQQKRY